MIRKITQFLFYSLLFLPIILFGQDDYTECPYFNVFSLDSSGVSFALASTDIDATISGVIANVEVEQLYLNTGDSTVNATYVFPMSTNAAIYSMEMDVNDRTIVAEIRRKDEAQEIFDNADSLGLTASLLEQERPNVFQMSLANIKPGDSLRIRMVYTELMVPTDGVYQFEFPSIVGPRYTTEGESWINQAAQTLYPVSQTDLNINLKINAGMLADAECVSHNTTFEYSGNSAETYLQTNPGADFIVDYSLNRDQIETGLLLYEGEDENFFLSIIQPPRPDLEYDSPEREYIFIMDISGSMKGEPIEVSKQLITDLLNDLNNGDKFNIIVFAGASSVLAPSSLPVTIENIDLAIDMIDNVSAGGGTNLLPAMEQALAMEGTDEYSRTFVILTDGFVSVEEPAFNLIRENLNEANFFSFGIGKSVNRHIIEGIAYVGEGEPFVVADLDDATEVANAFKKYIERPVLTNIVPSFTGIETYDVEPLTVPDVFAERPIIIYGKYNTPAEGSITIEGDYAGGSISSTLNFEDYTMNSDENIALQYLWARKKIKLMSDYGIASNENDTLSIEEEITLLGLKYSLITEFTSFVAVDSLAISSNDDNTNDDNDNGDGGGITEVEDIVFSDQEDIITVLGTITNNESPLRIVLKNIDTNHSMMLQITNVNGEVVGSMDLKYKDSDDILIMSVDRFPSGMYYISLLSEQKVIDTEKFIINN